MLTIKIQAVKRAIVVTAALAVLTGCTPAGPRALLEGKKLLDSGKAQAAAEKIKTATALMPTNALAFSYLGLACQQAGQLAEAERAYIRALALNHELAEAHFNLGCLYLEQQRLEQAKSELTAFTLRRSQNPAGFLKLGVAHLRARESLAAERSFAEALRLSPGNAEALTGMGLARTQRNRPIEATQFFSKALQEHPGYGPALQNLAIVAQEQLRDKALALKAYKQLLALSPPPENAVAVKSLVQRLEQELKPAAAIESPAPSASAQGSILPAAAGSNASGLQATAIPSRQAVGALSKGEPPSLTNASAARSNIVVTAAANPSKPLATNPPIKPPSIPVANTNLPAPTSPAPVETVKLSAEPVLKTGQDPTTSAPSPVKQDSSARDALGNQTAMSATGTNKAPKQGLLQKLNPARLFSSDTKGMPSSTAPVQSPSALPSATNDPPAADGGIVRYAYKNPTKPAAGNRADAERSYKQGVQAQQSQRLPEALQAYKRAIQLDPSFFNAYYNLALASTESSDLQTALATYETALKLRPDFHEARYNFALVLKQSNYPLDAANELEKILASLPNDSRAHLALGNLYAQQLGNTRLARDHYLKVLQIDPRNPQSANIHFWLTDHPK